MKHETNETGNETWPHWQNLGNQSRQWARAHREEHVVGQEVASQTLDFLGEGGTEHQRLALAGGHHVLLLHNPAQSDKRPLVRRKVSPVLMSPLSQGQPRSGAQSYA